MTTEQPPIKVGFIVKNQRQRRWGQVVWDERKVQFETGQPGSVLVWDLDGKGTTGWDMRDISAIVHRGKMIWENEGVAVRMDQEWREAVRREAVRREVEPCETA